MKRRLSLASVIVLATVLGCAGSDSTTGGPITPTLTIVTEPRVEAVTTVGRADLPGFVDPLNIQTGEQVQFQLVGYTADNVRVVLPVNDWGTSDDTNTFGQIANNSGVFLASDRQTPTVQYVRARYNDKDYFAEYQVRPRAIRVGGAVLSQTTRLPLRGIELRFYSDLGQEVGRAVTQYDGTFMAAVPNTATFFQVNNNTLPTDYFRLVRFNSDLDAVITKPAYMNLRNSNGVAIAGTLPEDMLTNPNLKYRRSGIDESCQPALAAASTVFTLGDYYLSQPILLVPTNATDDTGAVIDPVLVAEGCE